jgi:hypothetical protein
MTIFMLQTCETAQKEKGMALGHAFLLLFLSV